MIKLKVGHLYRAQCGCILRDMGVLGGKRHHLGTLSACYAHSEDGLENWVYAPNGLYYSMEYDREWGLHIEKEIKP